MTTSTLTSKGQVTIPKDIRERLRLHEGDLIDFVVGADGQVVLRPVTGSVHALAGLLHRPGRLPVSVAEMDDAIRGHAGDETRPAGRRRRR